MARAGRRVRTHPKGARGHHLGSPWPAHAAFPNQAPVPTEGARMLLARYLPNWETAIVSIGLTVPVVIIFMSLLVRSTSRRTQLHAQ